ncbi:MAG: hypothetical protein M3O61_13740 [Gemmatimonadota bacterium]|nr:hypothetical protein [Gemmatimonadota bacterium]
MSARRIRFAAGAAQLFAAATQAQHPPGHDSPDSSAAAPVAWSLGAQATGLFTVASPAYANRTLREGYLTQPMVMGMLSALDDRIVVHGMLDFEGITLQRGELDAGMHGEGYVDRRHPHTYLHELVASAAGTLKRTRFSFAAGKGFVAFGTDDPMVRPFVKYPANHHIAQIVERLLATVAVRQGPLLIEASRFNGDEPVSPSDWPNSERLWDSWSARATVFPAAGLEVQASHARVKSPELDRGGGLDQRKWNVSLRFEDEPALPGKKGDVPVGHDHEMHSARQMSDVPAATFRRYGLVEWGRSTDYDAGEKFFRFTTMLAEGELSRGWLAVGARLERTERPEEERLSDPFRTQRPSTDFSILGRTRWDMASVRLSARAWSSRSLAFTPFVEVGRQHVTDLATPSAFVSRDFYGSNTLWSYSVGMTISAGTIHRRSGTYGAAVRNAH